MDKYSLGQKVKINGTAIEYVGRHFASYGEVIGYDSEGWYLVRTQITDKGRFVRYDTPIWIKPEHVEKR